MLSTEDRVTVFEDEFCSTSKSGLSRPLELEMDRIEDWSVGETLESCSSSAVLATQTTTPPLLPT